MTIASKLSEIQTTLKAPKSNYNSFGKYRYRSCEDILEAVKPLCKEQNVILTISDEVVPFGSRFYIRATATLTDCETGETISGSALAREEETKKGMDASQITGTASTYARKYALNGLFCIDDTKDADSMDNSQQVQPAQQKQATAIPTITSVEMNNLQEELAGVGLTLPKALALWQLAENTIVTKDLYYNMLGWAKKEQAAGRYWG